MQSAPVSGGAIVSDVMIIGQAPGPREPTLKRPFAHTAGKTLFRWFEQFCGMDEAAVRSTIYFAAVCRCFPGKNSGGTDRVAANNTAEVTTTVNARPRRGGGGAFDGGTLLLLGLLSSFALMNARRRGLTPTRD